MEEDTLKLLRPVLVSDLSSKEAVFEMRPSDAPWGALRIMLEKIRPAGLGILLPLITQRHWYAYQEARARAIPVALAQPSNVSALTGLSGIVPLEAVVATEEAAEAFAADLREVGLSNAIRGWFIVHRVDRTPVFVPPSGEVFYDASL